MRRKPYTERPDSMQPLTSRKLLYHRPEELGTTVAALLTSVDSCGIIFGREINQCV